MPPSPHRPAFRCCTSVRLGALMTPPRQISARAQHTLHVLEARRLPQSTRNTHCWRIGFCTPVCSHFQRASERRHSAAGSCAHGHAVAPFGSRMSNSSRAQHAQHAGHHHDRRAATVAPGNDEGRMETAGTAEGAAPQVLAGKTAAVVGGGPGGMLCAAHLARLGAAVDVFERHHPAAVDENKPPPALWSIGLAAPADRAIAAAGLNPDLGPMWRFEGSAGRFPGSPPTFSGKWANKPMGADFQALATQPGIVAHLSAERERVYGAAVTITHGMRAVGGAVTAGQLVLEDSAGEQHERRFDMVVGADGVNSVVRQLIQEQDGSMHVKIEESAMGLVCSRAHSPGHPATYASLETPSGETFQGVPPGCDSPLEGCVVNFCVPSSSGYGGTGLCIIAFRHGGGEVSFTMTGDAARLREKRSADALQEEFEAAYPHLPRLWLHDMAEFLHSKTLSEDLRVRSPKFVTCSKIASGRAVLLGDAAHAVSPNIGMGCNAALQDSEVLSRACIAAGGDPAAAAQQYNATRLANAHIVTHVSKCVDAVSNYKYHKNVLAAAAGLPYWLPQAAARAPSTGFVAGLLTGLLTPGFNIERMFHELEDWTEIRRRVRWYTARLAGITLTGTAATAAALTALTKAALALMPP